MTSIYYNAARELHNEASLIPESYPELADYVNNPVILQQDKEQFEQEFDQLWVDLRPCMQEPVINEDTVFSGYSGHRIVQFNDTHYALGFHLLQLDMDKKYIQAERRLVCPDIPRLPYYIADTLGTEIDPETEISIEERRRKLGVLAGWADTFIEAEPYDNF